MTDDKLPESGEAAPSETGDATSVDPGPTQLGALPGLDHVPIEEEALEDTRLSMRSSRPAPTPVEAPAKRPNLPDASFDYAGTPATAPRRAGNLVPWLLLLMAIAGAALFVLWAHAPLREQLEQSQRDLEEARRDNVTLQRQVETLEASQRELAAEVEAREREVEALQSTQLELVSKLQKEIDKGNVLIKQSHGELVVDLVDKILFDSGEAAVNEQGQGVLRQVGETFLKIPDKLIEVSGHTDTVPISDKLLDEFPTNWELSAARATQVVRYLQEEVQVPGKRLAVVGRSQYAPVASNATKAGRRRNRRIEVKLMPLAKRR